MVKEGEYYIHPRETWNAATCRKKAKYTATDGHGTPYPFKGYIGSDHFSLYHESYGTKSYNGGCVRNGDWYEGETRLLPIIPDHFEIVHLPAWGYQIKEKVNETTSD